VLFHEKWRLLQRRQSAPPARPFCPFVHAFSAREDQQEERIQGTQQRVLIVSFSCSDRSSESA
jgi:hypothetical protein